MRFWLLSWVTACCAWSLVAYSTILEHCQHRPRLFGTSQVETYPHPYNHLRTTSKPVNPTIRQNREGSWPQKKGGGKRKEKKAIQDYAMKPTFDIPFGSNSTSAKRTSPAKYPRQPKVAPPCHRNASPCLIKSLRWCHLTSYERLPT